MKKKKETKQESSEGHYFNFMFNPFDCMPSFNFKEGQTMSSFGGHQWKKTLEVCLNLPVNL